MSSWSWGVLRCRDTVVVPYTSTTGMRVPVAHKAHADAVSTRRPLYAMPHGVPTHATRGKSRVRRTHEGQIRRTVALGEGQRHV